MFKLEFSVQPHWDNGSLALLYVQLSLSFSNVPFLSLRVSKTHRHLSLIISNTEARIHWMGIIMGLVLITLSQTLMK